MSELPLCKCERGPVMPSTTQGGKRRGYCKTCHWERVQRYRATPKGRESYRASKTKYKKNLRAEVLEAYGNACKCCGETQPVFLTIDHVNNDGGGRDREKGGLSFWLELKRLGFPQDVYRLLCFNCNTGRHINGGVCPHEEEKNRG